MKRTLTLKKKIKEVRVIFPKKKITFLAQFFYGELDFFIKKTKRAKAIDIFFQKWAF